MSAAWVYRQTERYEFGGLWTVGFYGPDGWEPESDHDTAGAAAARVHYLNGGTTRAWEELLVSLPRIADDLEMYSQSDSDWAAASARTIRAALGAR